MKQKPKNLITGKVTKIENELWIRIKWQRWKKTGFLKKMIQIKKGPISRTATSFINAKVYCYSLGY